MDFEVFLDFFTNQIISILCQFHDPYLEKAKLWFFFKYIKLNTFESFFKSNVISTQHLGRDELIWFWIFVNFSTRKAQMSDDMTSVFWKKDQGTHERFSWKVPFMNCSPGKSSWIGIDHVSFLLLSFEASLWKYGSFSFLKIYLL